MYSKCKINFIFQISNLFSNAIRYLYNEECQSAWLMSCWHMEYDVSYAEFKSNVKCTKWEYGLFFSFLVAFATNCVNKTIVYMSSDRIKMSPLLVLIPTHHTNNSKDEIENKWTIKMWLQSVAGEIELSVKTVWQKFIWVIKSCANITQTDNLSAYRLLAQIFFGLVLLSGFYSFRHVIPYSFSFRHRSNSFSSSFFNLMTSLMRLTNGKETQHSHTTMVQLFNINKIRFYKMVNDNNRTNKNMTR